MNNYKENVFILKVFMYYVLSNVQVMNLPDRVCPHLRRLLLAAPLVLPCVPPAPRRTMPDCPSAIPLPPETHMHQSLPLSYIV